MGEGDVLGLINVYEFIHRHFDDSNVETAAWGKVPLTLTYVHRLAK